MTRPTAILYIAEKFNYHHSWIAFQAGTVEGTSLTIDFS
jgi:hypothetical protein